MKPGDLVTIRRWNLTHKVPITYVTLYDRSSQGEYFPRMSKWVHDEVGVLMEGRDDKEEMVQVLCKGRLVWVDEEMLRDVNETR